METILPDPTLLGIQFAVFTAAYIVLKFLVWNPLADLIELRESKTSGLLEKAAESEQRAKSLRGQYEERMTEERKKAAAHVDQGKAETAEKERTILDAARKETAAELDTLREKVAQEKQTAAKALQPEVVELASQMSSQILGYPVKVKAASSAPPSREGQTEAVST